MPVRSIPKNYRNVTGVAAHSKAVGKVMFESTLERDFLSLLEFDREVESFEVQPVRLNWQDGRGRVRSYTPDVLVCYRNGSRRPVLWEVKYRDDLRANWQEYRSKFRAAVRYARERGWRFRLATEREIRGVRLVNARFLLPVLRRGCPDAGDVSSVLDGLRVSGSSTPALLLASLSPDTTERARLLPVLWYLVATGRVETDLGKKLTMANRIWSAGT
ncbi:TPA: TnsA endonuclease N-terminal domain-containing protein [Aeromonas dhakensis]|uniref:TnsA endonuclease N-terminal domain-containing protein n=1 Tax=Aeromonas dhakensis TaxID=196024 RepID=UPI000BAAA831|nr:TnsA endonuclease N-terminal domain-containing protein [Aeromonas dhakensis]ASX10981.1 heteromeric transposase endonuclease subunit TnsA [Aeromonas dhakensis]HDX8369175.1 TnsA endonuclease N-terminal domain-containing protein [Aeromonas dhakensis]